MTLEHKSFEHECDSLHMKVKNVVLDPLPQKVVVQNTWHNECDKKAYQIHHFSDLLKTLMSRVHISVMSVIKKHFECII